MRRQAAIILALSCRPDYIFFDETFDGLDPVMRGLVKSLICEDVAERGATAIITSHSLRELEDTCDQLALLHKGGLVMESDIQNLKTSLFKVQIALTRAYDQSIFAGIDVLQFHKSGSVDVYKRQTLRLRLPASGDYLFCLQKRCRHPCLHCRLH